MTPPYIRLAEGDYDDYVNLDLSIIARVRFYKKRSVQITYVSGESVTLVGKDMVEIISSMVRAQLNEGNHRFTSVSDDLSADPAERPARSP